MLRQRVIISIIALPIVIGIIAIGGWLYIAAVALALGLAASEYGTLFRKAELRPSLPLLAGGVGLLVVARFQPNLDQTALLLALLTLLAMTWHLLDFERGAPHSGTDFAVTLSGILYLGWIGAYLISLRTVPDGKWWVLTALPLVWLADSGAYFLGKRFGKREMTPRLSPNKTWEGYLSGVVVGTAAGAGLVALWNVLGADLSMLTGAVLGVVVATISPLGDLGISMMKREMKTKDTGTLLSAHGGALDRIDSWLWAGVLGYYIVIWAG